MSIKTAINDYLGHKNLIGSMKSLNDYVGGETLDASEAPKSIRSINHSFDDGGTRHSGFCNYADIAHDLVLTPGSPYYHRGCVLVIDDIPIGHVKFKGERTFLAWRTVENNGKYPILFGGIYEVSENLLQSLEEMDRLEEDEWNYVSVDSLSLNPGRFLNDSLSNLCKGNLTRDKIKKERDLVDKLLI